MKKQRAPPPGGRVPGVCSTRSRSSEGRDLVSHQPCDTLPHLPPPPSCFVQAVLTRRGARAFRWRASVHGSERCDAAQHPVRRALRPGAAGHLLREPLGPPVVQPALPSAAHPRLSGTALAARGSGSGLSVFRVLGADAVGALAAVAATAASTAAAAIALAVAAHAAAGAVAARRGVGLRLALLPSKRLPASSLFLLWFGPLVLQVQGRDQRTRALAGGAGRRAARLIGRGWFAAIAFVVVYGVGLRSSGRAFAFGLLGLVRRRAGGGPGSLGARVFTGGVAGRIHPAFHCL